MKKLFCAVLLMVSLSSLAQNPPGYSGVAHRYSWEAGIFKNGLHLPQYNGVPTDRTGVWIGDGAVAIDTANGYFYWRVGGTWIKGAKFSDIGSTPTWQQTLTAGSTLTGDNTVDVDGHILEFVKASQLYFASFSVPSDPTLPLSELDIQPLSVNIKARRDGTTDYSDIQIGIDSIRFNPRTGIINIDTLRAANQNQNTLLAWRQGTSQGPVGYVTLGAGLSMSGGVLNTSGTVATPISSLTAALANNTVAMGAFTFGLSSASSSSSFTTSLGEINLGVNGGIGNIQILDGDIGLTGTGISIPSSGVVVGLGGGASAGELRFLEPSGGGSSYSAFKAQAQGANITYTLPATVGAAGTVLTDAAGNGILSWAAGGGGSGDVTKVGTPVNNQVGVWTGDGTIEGDADLTFNGTDLSIGGQLGVTGKATFNAAATLAVDIPNGGGYEIKFTGNVASSNFYSEATGANGMFFNTAGGAIWFGNSDGSQALRVVSDNIGVNADPTSKFYVNGSFGVKYTGTATGITLDASHCVVNVTATGQTITLPTAASITGRQYTIKLTASGSCTVDGNGSETIDGATTYSLSAQYKYVTIVSDGTNWIITANN